MPPHVSRKRLRETTPENVTKSERGPSRRKATLYDDLDATATSHSLKQSDPILKGFDEDDSDSSLSSLSDGKFEDVPLAKRQKIENPSDEDEDDDVEFEDVEAPNRPAADAPIPSGDLELTLNRDTRISLTNQFGDKKGPSKRERKVRNATHCVHVLCLLWHNAVRNSWLCDTEVQAIMLSHLPSWHWGEVERWRRDSGMVDAPAPPKSKGKEKKGAERDSRDWGDTAKKLEEGTADTRRESGFVIMMKSLLAWWRKRFRITAPGLRKWGYMSLERLDKLTKTYKDHADEQDQFGERVCGLDDFRQCALECRGSRDVGAQLFTALLRGLGFDVRMVASLQPLGFGWNKLEDADPEETSGNEKSPVKKTPEKNVSKTEERKRATKKEPSRSSRSTRSTKQSSTSVVDDTDDLELEYKDTDDESVVEMKVNPKKTPMPMKKFDKDLGYPHYWTEILSPVTNKYLPVDPVVRGTLAINRPLIETFESRGAKADRARQVTAYIVGYSKDGTAKDVTVRYLKRQVLPGRTKGIRMALEKVPVYNRHGKVERYETFDWFKSAMSGYRRGGKNLPLTEADQQEDFTDLKAAKPEKKEVKEGEETLQYYKQSKEYVLQRHLKREESLRLGAMPVKVFKNKGKGSKMEEEDVYLRSDVVLVKSAETWHKQGRAPITGEEPLKRVPYRAATLNRKREILEVEAATGEKVLQGLYSIEQTDWIIPSPIKDGIIPKNEYGNIDLFVEHMCPKGAVHIPYRGVVKVCKRLQIDYAEAVVDFEFGHRMAVPVIQGVVIAEEYQDRVMAELEKDEAERVRKEDEKRRKAALGMWRKFLMGMRIVERIRQDYGEIDESVSVFGHNRGGNQANNKANDLPNTHDEDMAGGFLPEGYEEDVEADEQAHQTSSFFPSLEEGDQGYGDDGLVMEDHRHEPTAEASRSPRRSTRRGNNTKSKKRRKGDSEDDNDDDDDDE